MGIPGYSLSTIPTRNDASFPAWGMRFVGLFVIHFFSVFSFLVSNVNGPVFESRGLTVLCPIISSSLSHASIRKQERRRFGGRYIPKRRFFAS